MKFSRKTVSHHEDIFVPYDTTTYKKVTKTRWNIYTNKPIKQAGEYCHVLRRIVNESPERVIMLMEILEKNPKVIIFYNFDYELDILLNINIGDDRKITQWNGHKHEEIPKTEKWIYLVQFNSGSEGWNCTDTDTIIFYSQNYSYKIMKQACGRIDRLNTPFKDLYFYHLKSRSGIDLAISQALNKKKKFNEGNWVKW